MGGAGARGSMLPVGDPTRWGATVTTAFREVDPFATYQQLYSEQILQLTALDRYSRGWSLTGVLSLPPSVWDNAAGTYPDPSGAGLISINVLLEIVSGVGQSRLTQHILLAASGNPTLGLCNQQAAVNGGPYGQVDLPTDGAPFTNQRWRPFAAVGALVANNVSIRAVYEFVSNEYSPSTIVLLACPISAATGI
jgi:hypothetical protein